MAAFANPVSAETLAFQLTLDDARLVLEQSFALADEEYQANVTVRLRNTTSATFTPNDADTLLLSLGPGLGDQRVAGLGYAEAIYAFVEPITRVAGRIRQLRPESSTEEAISWSGDEVEWLGLHARYFALLVSPAGPVLRPQVSLPKSGATKYPMNHLPVLTWQLPLGDIASRAAAGGSSSSSRTQVSAGTWHRWTSLRRNPVPTPVAMAAMVVFRRARAADVHSHHCSRLGSFDYPPCNSGAPADVSGGAERHSEPEEVRGSPVARMRPELEIIKREFRGAEQSERILAAYGRHGISPFTGLKPALIVLMQLPVLVALSRARVRLRAARCRIPVDGDAGGARQAVCVWHLAAPRRRLLQCTAGADGDEHASRT